MMAWVVLNAGHPGLHKFSHTTNITNKLLSCRGETALHDRSVLADILSCFFIRVFLFFSLINLEWFVSKSSVTTLTARRRQRCMAFAAATTVGVFTHKMYVRRNSSALRSPQTIWSRLPISDNWTFFARVRAEALRANMDWKSPFWSGGEKFGQTFR